MSPEASWGKACSKSSVRTCDSCAFSSACTCAPLFLQPHQMANAITSAMIPPAIPQRRAIAKKATGMESLALSSAALGFCDETASSTIVAALKPSFASSALIAAAVSLAAIASAEALVPTRILTSIRIVPVRRRSSCSIHCHRQVGAHPQAYKRALAITSTNTLHVGKHKHNHKHVHRNFNRDVTWRCANYVADGLLELFLHGCVEFLLGVG